ncbi:MAG TPA: ornithine carbamoyltransferase, partial [Lachnospiraceae bacterium]|nr:ornithine carbamoyltransferase [Lachnospiraceae bacterium]
DFYEEAKKSGHYVELDPTMSMEEAKKYADIMDVLYTDTWVDMEFFNNPAYKEKKEETLAKMMPYQINDEFMKDSKAIVLHDMPMHVGYEISESVEMKNLDHILDQAENRRHAEKAVMYTLINS